MDKQKLSRYILTGSIHTLQIQVPGEVVVPPEMTAVECRMKRDKQGNIISSLKINPNAAEGDIFSFDKYNNTVDSIFDAVGITDYRIIRADLRLDSIQGRFLKDFWKVHKYLLSGLAKAYNVRNKYQTTQLVSNKKLSLAIKGRGFEVEFYDKQEESNGTDIVTARFEERSKATGTASLGDLRTEFSRHWKIRWKEALNNLYAVTEDYNRYMIPLYMEQVVKNGMKTNEFLVANAENFFTRNQMIRFLRAVGYHNPEGKVKDFKKSYADKCNIEFYSLADCRQIVKEIMRATTDFFDSQIGEEIPQNEAI